MTANNEATTSIKREDLVAFLTSTGHEPRILAVSEGAKGDTSV
jgi:Ala-tRNA(Pro) deacylase